MKIKIITALLVAVSVSGCASRMYRAKAEFLCRDDGGFYVMYIGAKKGCECRSGRFFTKKEIDEVIIDDPEYYLGKD